MSSPKSILIPADVSRLARTLDPTTGLGTAASLGIAASDPVGMIGDSLSQSGGGYALGAVRPAFYGRVRRTRSSVCAWGPQISVTTQSLALNDMRGAGYPGETIAQITTRCQAAGSIYTYAATASTPRAVFVSAGTNDAAAGRTATQMLADMTALLAAVAAMLPTTRVIVCSIPKFYAPTAPTGGLATANAYIATFNAGLAALCTAQGPLFSYCDDSSALTQAHAAADGTHLTPEGQAVRGNARADAFETLAFVGHGPPSPRPFSTRAAVAAAQFLTITTDCAVVTDPGFELQAANFAFLAELRLTDWSAATVAIAQCTPAGQNYSHGWLVSYDSASKAIALYLKSLGAAVSGTVPADAFGRPMWLAAHADYTAGVASLYLAYVPSGGTHAVVACIGQATGVAAWAAGDASGVLTVGKNGSFSGFAGQVRRVEVSRGADVPGVDSIVRAIEAAVYEGAPIPGMSGALPLNEGTGTTVTSGAGIAGTLTGGWASAGTYAWPSEEAGGSSILMADNATEWDWGMDRRVRAVFDASQGVIQAALAVSQWSSVVGDLTGIQATGANKPAYNAAGINGRPSLDFNGTTTFLALNKFGAALGAEAIAPQCDQLFVAVLKPAGAFSTGRYLLDVATGRTICAVNDSSLGNKIGYYGAGWASLAGAQIATTNAQVLAWEFKAGVGTRIFLNGVQIGATDPSNAVATALGSVACIGSNNGGSSSFYQGSVGAFAIAAGKVDNALRTRITRKLGALYGVPVTT